MANPDYEQLRHHIDSNDPFMSRGHQIIKIRRGWRRSKPSWVESNKAIQELVLRSFPKLKTDNKQRAAAARWVRVIQLYFRLGWTAGQIAEELKTTRNVIKCIIKAVRRAILGQRADNTGPRVKAGSGRPRKHDPIQTPHRDPHEDHRKVGAGTLL